MGAMGAVDAHDFDCLTVVAALFFLARLPRERIGPAADSAERPHPLADLAEGQRSARARFRAYRGTVGVGSR